MIRKKGTNCELEWIPDDFLADEILSDKKQVQASFQQRSYKTYPKKWGGKIKDNRKEEKKKKKKILTRFHVDTIKKNDKFVVKIYLNISWEKFRLAVAVRETGVEFEGEKKKWLDVRGRARAQALHSRDRGEGVDIFRVREQEKERKKWSGEAWKGETSAGEREGW